MAFVHGKNSYIALDDSGGTLRDLSSFCDSISGLPGAKDLSEVTAFGDDGVKNIPGLENVTFSISGHFDPTASTGPHATLTSIRAATSPVDFVYCPQGNSSGNVEFSGKCWLSSYEVESSVDDKVSFSGEFQVDGTVTIGTVS